MTTQPIPPGERLPDAKVLVDYWTLDCLLDWVFHHWIHHESDWSPERHHDRLREDMERFVTDADLRQLIAMYRTGTRNMASDDKVLDRLRAALGEQP